MMSKTFERNIEILKAECKDNLIFLIVRYHEIYLYETIDYISKEEKQERIKNIDIAISFFLKWLPKKHKNKLIECGQYLGSSRELVGNHRYRVLNKLCLFEAVDMMKNSQNSIEKEYN